MNKLYVAADKNGKIYLYNSLPFMYSIGYTTGNIRDFAEIPKDLFPDLKFEDGPIEVKLIEVK